MNPIPLIERYLDRELTTESARELASAPKEHLPGLFEAVQSYYFDWLESAEKNTTNTQGYLYCIDPAPRRGDWRNELEYCKRCLLYMPRFAIADPLAAVLKPSFAIAEMTGQVTIDDELRSELLGALLLLANLSPSARDGDILLVPTTFAYDYTSVQESVRAELDALKASPQCDTYYEPIMAAIDREYVALLRSRHNEAMGSPSSRSDHLVRDIYIEATKIAGTLCARLDLSPVAGSDITHAILKQDYNFGGIDTIAPAAVHKMTDALMRYELPGISKADVDTIRSIRKNDAVFEEFRRGFASAMTLAAQQQPSDQLHFEVEFRQACQDLLRPRVEELKKAAKSSAVEKILIPGAVNLGVAAAAYHITGNLPVSTIASAAATPLNWVLEKLYRRYNASGRKATALTQAYGILMDTASSSAAQ